MTLHHALVSAPHATPERWMLVLHGIFGAGANWRSFARALADRRPSWGFALVDLRGHGQSPPGDPPYTVEAAAADLAAFEANLRVAGVLGHSFGGKVALAYADRRAAAGSPLTRAFLLDASPGTRPLVDRPGDSRDVLALLRALPAPLPSRERFVELVEGAGYSRVMADWLAMNVRRSVDGFRLRLDLDVMQRLLDDYFSLDAWPILERVVATTPVDVVIGGRSDSILPDDRRRLEEMAAHASRLSVHVLPNAGHWLQVDDPDGLLRIADTALTEEG